MKSILFLFVLTVSASAFAGPFGLEKGMTLSDLRKHGEFVKGNGNMTYKTSRLTNGHDAFEFYEVMVSPTKGLCKVAAAGKDIQSNSFGDQVRNAFRSLEEPLIQKYGAPSNRYDFLQAGSIWKDRNDWMMALLKEERTLTTFWDSKKLPDSLGSIMLESKALSSSKGWISLHYEFDNVDVCIEEAKQKKNSNL